jgi:CubicO group peptidase (beta-lactamase class C family)
MKFLKKLAALFIVFFVSLQISAQTLFYEVKTNPHIDSKKLAQIDALVNDYISKHWINGATVLIAKDNQIVYHKALGYANLTSKKTMPENAIYRIMSQSKAITSLAVLQLFEQGKFDLDDPIGNFIPSFKNQKVVENVNLTDTTFTTVPAKRQVTIRDLLTHSAGIDYTDIGSRKMSAIYNKAEIPSGLGYFNASLLEKMTALGNLPLAHQPGEKFTYGLNTDILGCLVEIISGMSLEAYCQKNIFDPLGMKDTYFNVPENKADRMPNVYTENEQHEVIDWGPTFRKINPNYPLMKKTYFSGGAGLSSTAYDYAIFLQMILNKGRYNGRQIISPRTAELMVSPQLNYRKPEEDNFSLGFSLTSEKNANLNLRNAGSFSWGGYYGTNYWADPRENLVVLIMTQQTPNSHSELKNKIENIIYGSLSK